MRRIVQAHPNPDCITAARNPEPLKPPSLSAPKAERTRPDPDGKGRQHSIQPAGWNRATSIRDRQF